MKWLFSFLNILAILSYVASLGIMLQPQTIVGSPTLVLWTRDDTDQDTIKFDLRFVQENADVGLALANLVLGQEDQFGTGLVTFSAEGQFVLKAVTGPQNTVIGTSNKVATVTLTSSSSSTLVSTSATTLASTSTSSSISTDNTASPSSASITAAPITSSPSQPNTSNTSSSSNSNSTRRLNRPAVIGGVIGGVLILVILVLLFVLVRRRKALRNRLTFQKDVTAQPRLIVQPLPNQPSTTPSELEASGSSSVVSMPTTTAGHVEDYNQDVELGLAPSGVFHPFGSGDIVLSPRPPPNRTNIQTQVVRPITILTARSSLEIAALRTRRQQLLAYQIQMLRHQIKDTQKEQGKVVEADSGIEDDGVEAERSIGDETRVSEETHRKIVWLRDHEQSAWAMGLTDVLPPGYARYMLP